ncbi:MAG: RluA family pseudouridine synthase [Acidimicrobiales bacterium]
MSNAERQGWQVPTALEGERIDRALSLLTGMTRSQVSELITAGAVSVGDRVVTSRSKRVHFGEQVSAPVVDVAESSAPSPDGSVAVAVVWADDEVAVINKPAGLVVHPGSGQTAGTLVNGLLARFPELADVGEADRPGIVHRLDKGTSGLLVVARTPGARRSLVSQLAARAVERRYAALVSGTLGFDEGVVDAPLGRSHSDPTRMAVVASGRTARTRYRVVARYDNPWPATLLECQLESGRTHQVRVHLATIGHPVVGDERYGPGVPGRKASGARATAASPGGVEGRAWLHARVLGFDHPVTAERLRFVSPLPAELSRSLEAMHAAAGGLLPEGWL